MLFHSFANEFASKVEWSKNYIHICLFRLHCGQRAFNIIISRMCDASTSERARVRGVCGRSRESIYRGVWLFKTYVTNDRALLRFPSRVARSRVSRADLSRFFPPPLYSRKCSFTKALLEDMNREFLKVGILWMLKLPERRSKWNGVELEKNLWIAIMEVDIVWRWRYFPDRTLLFCIGNIEIKISSESKVFFAVNNNLSF